MPIIYDLRKDIRFKEGVEEGKEEGKKKEEKIKRVLQLSAYSKKAYCLP